MPERRTIQVGTKRVRLLVGGEGPPLVYLHGAGPDVEWLEAHERLAARRTVYLPAHPGFSTSTGIEEVDGIFDLVLHTIDLLDALDLRAAPLVGASLGGWIAAEVAALYPDRVAALVLVDAVGIWIDGEPIREMFAAPPPELATMLFHDQSHPVAMVMHAFTSVADVPEEIVLSQLKAMEATAKVGWNPYLHDPKLEGRLGRVTAPTLVLWGRQDGLVPFAYAERWRDRIRGARLQVIEGCGHLPAVERPAEFAGAVLAFLG